MPGKVTIMPRTLSTRSDQSCFSYFSSSGSSLSSSSLPLLRSRYCITSFIDRISLPLSIIQSRPTYIIAITIQQWPNNKIRHSYSWILMVGQTVLPCKKTHVHLCDDVWHIRIKAHVCISENKIKQVSHMKKNKRQQSRQKKTTT